MKKKTAVLDRRLQLEYRPISKLVPNAHNARTHPPEQIDINLLLAPPPSDPGEVPTPDPVLPAVSRQGDDGAELYVSGTTPKGRKVRHITVKAGGHAIVQPDSDTDDLWQVSRGSNKDTLHPTQKPLELARKAIKNSTMTGQAVLDMFSGSASTLIACEQLGRICYAIDLEPKWEDVGIRRWQQMTGKQAIHVHDRKPFDERAPRKAKAR